MAYIYKIINDVNQKIYIGKTEFSIEKRFQEHCRDAFKEHNEKRPLYSAMKKYGIENFHIELIEETDNPEEREVYWIEYYGSFKNGYNATKGGDGRKYIDYDLVVSLYKEFQSVKDVALFLKIDEHSVGNILKNKNIEALTSSQVLKKKYGIPIGMYNKENILLKTFSSYTEASQWLIKQSLTNCKESTIRTHISEVCRGKRKTAAGYIWKQLL